VLICLFYFGFDKGFTVVICSFYFRFGLLFIRDSNSSGIDMAGTMDFDNFTVGIIGMGDMGKMYARRLSDAGWR